MNALLVSAIQLPSGTNNSDHYHVFEELDYFITMYKNRSKYLHIHIHLTRQSMVIILEFSMSRSAVLASLYREIIIPSRVKNKK